MKSHAEIALDIASGIRRLDLDDTTLLAVAQVHATLAVAQELAELRRTLADPRIVNVPMANEDWVRTLQNPAKAAPRRDPT